MEVNLVLWVTCDLVLNDPTISRNSAVLRTAALKILGESFMAVCNEGEEWGSRDLFWVCRLRCQGRIKGIVVCCRTLSQMFCLKQILSSCFSLSLRPSAIWEDSCNALQVNTLCCECLWVVWFPYHLVWTWPWYTNRASLIRWRFRFVEGQDLMGFFSLMPLYAVACEIVNNFTPWRSNSMGMSRYRLSGVGLFTASVVRWSAASFPMLPVWPLVHWKDVVAVRCFRKLAVALKRAAFFIPIQPLSSQVLKCLVRLLIAYWKSEMILRGKNFGIAVAALSIAIISPAWLDWELPEGWKAKGASGNWQCLEIWKIQSLSEGAR